MDLPRDRPILDYPAPTRPAEAFNVRRAVTLAAFTGVLTLGAAAWAHFGTQWILAQPWFQSGHPIDLIWEPRLIGLPLSLATIGLAIECVVIFVMVIRGRWQSYWLAALPIIGIAWIALVGFMLGVSENIFP